LLLNCRDFMRPVVPLLVAASFLYSPVIRASERSQASLQQGIAAYEAGEYQKAIDYFDEAIRLGSTQPSLYYNLGVAYYRLGQYEAADEAFKKVAESPKWEALALYNRALIAYRQNQPEIAKLLVTSSVRLSNSPGLTALNFRLLDKLENKKPAKQGWSKLIRFGAGYNDNVVLVDVSAISGKSDYFLDATGRLQRTINLKNSKKLKFLLQANQRDYAKLNEYDQFSLRGGFEKDLNRPNSTLGGYLDHVSLGGQDFELVSSLTYRRTLTNRKSSPPEFTYSLSHYSMLNSTYDYLGGVRHQVRLAKKIKLEKGSLKNYLLAEYNDREDQTVSGNFYSYSPVRLGVGTVYTKNLSSRDLLSGSLYLQQSRYLKPDKRGTVFKTREDGFLQFGLGFAHVSPTHWIYRVNYISTVNSSNYSEFSYNQNIVSFDIFKSF
jgi:tetratricopeptide (TPR) repeat protein